jgi:hypothetical protein
VSEEILTLLRDKAAFKPKPPDYELAHAHVPLATVGLPDPVEDRVIAAMRSEDENSVLILAPPGSGKSSLLAWAAARASELSDSPHVLPVYVPVGHHTAAIDAATIVRGVAEGIAGRLEANLDKRQRRELEQALAITITTARRPAGLRAQLSLPPVHGLSAKLAGELGGDLVTLVKAGGWQGGPRAGLVALADLARAKNGRLVVIVEDTDIWSAGDENMARRAGGFFAAVRTLLDCPEVTLLAAVQSHWAETQPLSNHSKHTTAARVQFRELKERAGRVLHVPTPTSHEHARVLVRAVLERRIDITLDPPAPDGGWSAAVFTPDAIEVLARRCLDRSVRQILTDVRDTFDHHDTLPPRIEREHLIEAMSA